MRCDGLASTKAYLDHLAPIWRALPDEHRGTFRCTASALDHARHLQLPDLDPRSVRDWLQPRDRPVMVAAYADLMRVGSRPAIFVEHGAGQTYAAGEQPESPYYAGGTGRDSVALFLCPNRDVAEANRRRYPDTPTAVVGCPRLDDLYALRQDHAHTREREGPTVACSFHWPCKLGGPEANPRVPESGWAWPDFQQAIPHAIRSNGARWLGHGHPRAWRRLDRWWLDVGAVPTADFGTVAAEATVYVCDNSSTIYEAAALGIPVVLMNARHWRRDVEHGLRFWRETPGIMVDDSDDLIGAIQEALVDDQWRQARSETTSRVYGVPIGGATTAAVAAIVDYLS